MTAPATRMPRTGEVPVRRFWPLVKAGARQSRTAWHELRYGLDLGPGVDPTVRAKAIEARPRLTQVLARIGLGVLVAWLLALGAAVWSVDRSWQVPALGLAGSVMLLLWLRNSAAPVLAYPLTFFAATGAGWMYAGWRVVIVFGIELAVTVLAGVVTLVAMAWRDGSVLDNLGITRTHVITPDLIQSAIASAVLGAKGDRLAAAAASVRITSPIVTLPEGGWRTTVILPGAVTAEKAIEAITGIASYLETPSQWMTITQGDHDAEIGISAYDHDPYARGGAPSPLAADPRATSIWEPIRIGTTLDGSPVTVSLAYSGVLIGGRPRTGKTVVEAGFLAHALLDHGCDVYIGDGKEVDTWAAREVAAGYVGADPAAMADMLGTLLDRVFTTKSACRDLGLKRLTEHACREHGLRPAVLFVDELAYYTRATTREGKETAEIIMERLARIVEYGPAFGVWVVLATQYPRGDVIDARIRQIPVRIALPTSDRIASDLILGEGSNARGHRSHLFPPDTVGVAVVKAARTQTVLIDDFDTEDDLDTIVACARRMREVTGTLPEPVAVSQTPQVLADAAALFAELGTDRLPSAVLADRLGYDSPEALADVLRPLGVRPSVRRFTGGTQARGYLRSQFAPVPIPVTTPVPNGVPARPGDGLPIERDGGRYGAKVIPIRRGTGSGTSA
jgi:hypothetical protein